MKAGQSTLKVPVFVNGIYCASINEGAEKASFLLNKSIDAKSIWLVLKGKKEIKNLKVINAETMKTEYREVEEFFRRGLPLLNYPQGQHPSETGLPEAWK